MYARPRSDARAACIGVNLLSALGHLGNINVGTLKDMIRNSVGKIRVANLTGLTNKAVHNIRVTNIDGVDNSGAVKLSATKLMGVAKSNAGKMVVTNLADVKKSGASKIVVDNFVGIAKGVTSNFRFSNTTGVAKRDCGNVMASKLLGIINRSVGNLRVTNVTGVATQGLGNLRVTLYGCTAGTHNLRVNLIGCCERSVGNLRLNLIGTGPSAGIRVVLCNNGSATTGVNIHFGGRLFCAVLKINSVCRSLGSGFSTDTSCHTNVSFPICGKLSVDKSLNCRRVRTFSGGSRMVPGHLCTLRTHTGLRCRFAPGFNVFTANNCKLAQFCGGSDGCSGNIVVRTNVILFWGEVCM